MFFFHLKRKLSKKKKHEIFVWKKSFLKSFWRSLFFWTIIKRCSQIKSVAFIASAFETIPAMLEWFFMKNILNILSNLVCFLVGNVLILRLCEKAHAQAEQWTCVLLITSRSPIAFLNMSLVIVSKNYFKLNNMTIVTHTKN